MRCADVAASGGEAAGADAAVAVITGRDIVVPADAGLGAAATAGRDMVDDAAGTGGGTVPAAGRIPVAEAEPAAGALAGTAGAPGAAAGAPGVAAGRIPVAEAAPAAGTPAATAGRAPVEEAALGAGVGASAATAGREPVAEADAGETGFGGALMPVAPAVLAGGAAAGATAGALPAPAAGTRVVPHCTQNFAPG